MTNKNQEKNGDSMNSDDILSNENSISNKTEQEELVKLKKKIQILEEALVDKDNLIEELKKRNSLLTKLSLKLEERNLELLDKLEQLKESMKDNKNKDKK